LRSISDQRPHSQFHTKSRLQAQAQLTQTQRPCLWAKNLVGGCRTSQQQRSLAVKRLKMAAKDDAAARAY